MKKCSICCLELELGLFYKDPTKTLGFSTYCKECTKQKSAQRYNHRPRIKLSPDESRLRRKQSKAKYRMTHPEKIHEHNRSERARARAKKWREENKIYSKAWRQNYYLKNITLIRDKHTAGYIKNFEKIRIAVRNRRINNRIAVNAEKAAYKAKVKAGRLNTSLEEHKAVMAFYKQFPSSMYQIDHIIPLDKKKGGVHCLGNLQAIPKSGNLNQRKSNKIGRFSFHPLGICCLPAFEGIKKEHLEAIHGGPIDL
jgi:hypothetical protein